MKTILCQVCFFPAAVVVIENRPRSHILATLHHCDPAISHSESNVKSYFILSNKYVGLSECSFGFLAFFTFIVTFIENLIGRQ